MKTEQKDPNAVTGLPQNKPIQVMNITSLGNETAGEILDASTAVTKELPSSSSEAIKPASSNVNQTVNTTVLQDTKKESTTRTDKESEFGKSTVRDKKGEVMQNGVTHVNSEGNLTDIILKDLENGFEDMLQNISDNSSSSVSQTPTSSTVKTTNSQPKSKEKKESKNLNNNNMMNPSMTRGNEFPTSVPNMANLGSAPPYPNGVGNMQLRPQVPSPMGIGPQIRRHLVDHIQGRGRQQVGPAPYAAMNSMPVREPLVAGTQTKNPETMAKVQEHLLFKKQMQQRQMEMMRQQMQQQMPQPYQQPTYQQQLMQMAQAAQQQQQHSPSPMSPMMQSLSPHLQQQAFMQQNMNSPVPSPMSTTPVLNRNPFQFPHDYNAYMNQQKQMQAYDGMGNMPSQHDGTTQMPMNYYQGPQQDPFPGRQPMPNQSNMHAPTMQSAAMRAMLTRERMMSPDSMPQGQILQGPVVGPPGSFPSQPPKQPPPQYTQNNFSPPNIPLERPQLQRSLSHPRNRLSHFSHPDEMQSYNAQPSVSMKSPGTLPMYPNMDNNMYTMGATASSIANGGQPNTNAIPTRMTESSFSNFQSYGPPNMSLTTAMNSRTTMSPTNWAHENQLQKQQTLQHMRMNMNSEYRMPLSKGPTVNLNSRPNNVGQSRRTPAQFTSPIEKQSSDVPNMAPNQMMSPQQGPKVSLGTTLKQEPIVPDSSSQPSNPSDDLESILSDPPENFDLVKLLG